MKRICSSIIFFAFLIQALIPVGFMPVFAKDGTTIVICSGLTGETIEIPFDDPSSKNHDEDTTSQCPYFNINSYDHKSIEFSAVYETAYILFNVGAPNVTALNSYTTTNQTRGPPVISLT